MIARHPHRLGPIPFSNNALVFQCPSRQPASAALLAREPDRSPWSTAIAQLTQSTGVSRPAGSTPSPGSASAPPASGASPLKATRARYDGPHALSIRSATSGRHYRFEHPGAEQVIDTIDISMLRKIEGITII